MIVIHDAFLLGKARIDNMQLTAEQLLMENVLSRYRIRLLAVFLEYWIFFCAHIIKK